jgi:hypothetical protein
MGQVTAYTAEKTIELLGENIVGAHLSGYNLILEKRDGTTVDVGNIRGGAGPSGGVDLATVQSLIAAAILHPGAKATRGATQAVANTTFTQVAFTGPDERDTNSYHAANATKMIIPNLLGGWYDVKANATLVSGVVGWSAILEIHVNGVNRERLQRLSSVDGPTITLSGATELSLAVGDEVELTIWQDSGSAKDVSDVALSLHRIAA